ncbi:hypothetical protein D3C76_1803580 [compost metagenome]
MTRRNRNNVPTAIRQVTTSMKKIVDKGATPSSAPLAMGATSIIRAWMLPLMPLTRVN